jgi:anti-sigma B factor antagonist
METSILRSMTTDGTALVVVAGEVDFTNADEVSDCIAAAVAQWQPAAVRVDLARASFIDSTGLGALIAGYRVVSEADALFSVVNVRPSFLRVLEVTGLCEMFGLSAERDSDVAI